MMGYVETRYGRYIRIARMGLAFRHGTTPSGAAEPEIARLGCPIYPVVG
jgi:hypothetical protein